MKCYLNGNIVDEAEAKISIYDRSYLYGEGVFETLRCYDAKPAFLPRHFRRLQNNCASLQIPLHIKIEKLGEEVQKLLNANGQKEAVVRLTISCEGAAFGIQKPSGMKTNLSIFSRPLQIDPKIYETGVEVAIPNSVINDAPQLAGIKSTNYLVKMKARDEAAVLGVHESLLINEKGYIIEGSRTNLFSVKNGVVLTPPLSDGLLPGITREVLIEIIRKKNIPFEEVHFTREMLKEVDELFLTGSTTEVLGIHTVRNVIKMKRAAVPVVPLQRDAVPLLTSVLHRAYQERAKNE